MALTKDQITEGHTYTVRFEFGALSGKRFNDAKNMVKGIGGRFDSATRLWTVTIGSAETTTVRQICGACGGIGRRITESRDYCLLYDAQRRPCANRDRHAHTDENCGICDSTGRVSRERLSPADGLSELRTLASIYNAVIEPV